MKCLWSFNAFLAAISGNLDGSFKQDITGISIDSRTLKRGDAFFAIRGIRFDGHDFLEIAIRRGASILVVDQKSAEKFMRMQKESTPCLFVRNVLSALEELALAARIRTKAKIIAITGSVGKTTMKEMLRHVLTGKIHANPASLNNHWGVPLTLARMPFNTDFGIFEIGMSHANEIRSLVKLVRPNLVVIIQIGAAHLGNFNNLQEIANAKAEIFEAIQPGGYVLLNADDCFFSYLTDIAKNVGIKHVFSFGKRKLSDYRLLNSMIYATYSQFKIAIRKKQITGQLTLTGFHMIQNALATLGIIDLLQEDIDRAAEALQTFIPENGRGRLHILSLPNDSTFLLIDESYNANPTSMRAGLEILALSDVKEKGRRVAVLGDMLELGSFSKKAHEDLFLILKKNHIELVFLCGKEMRFLSDILISVKDNVICHCYRQEVEDLLPLIQHEIHADDVVMIKSSNKIGTSRLVTALIELFRTGKNDCQTLKREM